MRFDPLRSTGADRHDSAPDNGLSRRIFLKGGVAAGGGLLLGFGLPACRSDPVAQSGRFAPNAFIRIGSDGWVTLTMPYVEMGQGTYTAIPMLIAEELEVDLSQVRLEHAPPDEKRYGNPLLAGIQATGNSNAIRAAWEPLRQAGATARVMLIAAAAKRWKVDPSSCHAERGEVVHQASTRKIKYGALVADAAGTPVPQNVALKRPEEFKLIGTPAKRLDAPSKVDGTAVYGINARPPGLKIATLAQSPVFGGRLKSVDDTAAKAVKGVRQVVRLDDAVAVVADHMGAAKKGLAALIIQWDNGPHATLSTGITRAVQIAMQVDGPVKVIWTREEDIQHDMYRPYFFDRISAGLDEAGRPVAWSHRFAGSSIIARWLPPGFKNGLDPDTIDGAIDLPYALPNARVEYLRVEPPGIPTAFWRSVGPSHNVFVVESFMDELAAAAKKDPVEYRRALLDNAPRAKAVLQLAAEKAGWGRALPKGSGRGISMQSVFGTHMAQVAEVEVAKDGGVRVRRVVCAVDCGSVVNPDTVQAQVQSAVIFGISAALFGKITLKDGRVEQSNFSDYPVLRMNEAPAIEVHIVKNTESPGGMGEPGTSAIVPAVINAIFAATGKRVRKLPVDPAELKQVSEHA